MSYKLPDGHVDVVWNIFTRTLGKDYYLIRVSYSTNVVEMKDILRIAYTTPTGVRKEVRVVVGEGTTEDTIITKLLEEELLK